MRLEILLTAILFFGGALFTGYGLRRVLKLHKEGFLFSIVAGVMAWWALMELILVPMTMKLASFHSFVMVYTVTKLWKDASFMVIGTRISSIRAHQTITPATTENTNPSL